MPIVNKPWTFSNGPGNVIDATQVNANWDTLYNAINGLLDADNLAPAAVKFEVGHTISLAGEVRVPSGQLDVIPPLFVPVSASQTSRLLRVRHRIALGTSATFKVQRNGVDVPGMTGLVAGTTAGEASAAPTVTLADDDALQVVVTAVAGTPQNMSVTLILEHASA